MFPFRRQLYLNRGPDARLLTKGVNAWYTGKYIRSQITGREKPQIKYTINSRGRTGAAERLKLMRRKG